MWELACACLIGVDPELLEVLFYEDDCFCDFDLIDLPDFFLCN